MGGQAAWQAGTTTQPVACGRPKAFGGGQTGRQTMQTWGMVNLYGRRTPDGEDLNGQTRDEGTQASQPAMGRQNMPGGVDGVAGWLLFLCAMPSWLGRWDHQTAQGTVRRDSRGRRKLQAGVAAASSAGLPLPPFNLFPFSLFLPICSGDH